MIKYTNMQKIKIKMQNATDVLMDKYVELVEEASQLESVNPKKALVKLTKASLIEKQIEELKMAIKN